MSLLRADFGRPQVGADLNVVLYWQAASPIAQRYTVFTQVLNPAGQVVAQQDNPPVNGTAPTDTWQPGAVIRDPYRLALPNDLPPGAYQLIAGLYDANGRVQWTLPSGERVDHVSFVLQLAE